MERVMEIEVKSARKVYPSERMKEIGVKLAKEVGVNVARAMTMGCRFFTLSVPRKLNCCCRPQWGAADAEIEVPSHENTELKRSPFKAWRSVYWHARYVYSQGFLPC